MQDDIQAIDEATPVEEVNAPVEAVTDEAATSETDEQKEATRKQDGIQKRINELTRKARENERKAQAEAERREALEREIESLRKGEGAEPKPDKFETYEEYLDAKADWLVDQKLKQHSSKSEEGRRKAAEAEEHTRKAARLDAVYLGAKESYPDFDEVFQGFAESVPDAQAIKPALDTVLESDRAGDLLYYLAKNPSAAVKLSDMSPLAQAREIGRLEALFESKKLTAAPPPTQTLKGTGSRVATTKPPTDPEEYRKWRAKQKG